jgi:hypothetical protein
MAVRAVAIWGGIILAEVAHGIARVLILEPIVGDFRARQIAVFTGSAIILGIALASIRWLRPSSPREALGAGAIWLALTLTFEILFGRFVAGASWDRLWSDYNLLQGGLLPLGLLVLTMAPLGAAHWRGLWTKDARLLP